MAFCDLIGTAYGSGACAGSTKPCKDWIVPASFANNPAGTFNTSGKGQFRFPGFYSWDMALAKNFSITERLKIQLRGEYFNILNHVNFDESTATGNFSKLSSKGNFGALQQAYDPRIRQIALKILF